MMENYESGRVQRLSRDAADYVGLRLDAFRLAMVDALSTVFSNGLGVLVLLVLITVAFMFFIMALTLLLAEAIGSFVWALIIAGVFLLVVSFVLFALRHALADNMMVRMFGRLFFPPKTDDDEA